MRSSMPGRSGLASDVAVRKPRPAGTEHHLAMPAHGSRARLNGIAHWAPAFSSEPCEGGNAACRSQPWTAAGARANRWPRDVGRSRPRPDLAARGGGWRARRCPCPRGEPRGPRPDVQRRKSVLLDLAESVPKSTRFSGVADDGTDAVVAAGNTTDSNGTDAIVITRLTSSGAPDASFGSGGSTRSAVQPAWAGWFAGPRSVSGTRSSGGERPPTHLGWEDQCAVPMVALSRFPKGDAATRVVDPLAPWASSGLRATAVRLSDLREWRSTAVAHGAASPPECFAELDAKVCSSLITGGHRASKETSGSSCAPTRVRVRTGCTAVAGTGRDGSASG